MAEKNIRRRVTTPTMDSFTADPLLTYAAAEEPEDLGFSKFVFTRNKFNWYWAPPFLIFWVLLYFFIILPSYHSLPKPLTFEDELENPGSFIAERAEQDLRQLIRIGPRVVGSDANEKETINFFQEILKKIISTANPVHEIEIDIQVASGSYCHWDMINMYQSIQNFIVKLSPKNGSSTSYLLVNSHFDSVPGGPGAGDDGTMVVVMLETLRVLSSSQTPLEHPVVFLFNGAEENPLQASHAFITQHKWAKNCKAVINLDSAGNGGQEILFQSGPNHPWLMRYYRKNALHPFASTVAEELFQRNFIPSDTDFRIFRDFGNIPGLDMAHSYNGYVYHTKFDRPEIIPLGTFQNTGDNVLAITKAIANAPELRDTKKYAEGHTVFYDVMGTYMIFYTESQGVLINLLVSTASLVVIGISLQNMASNSGLKIKTILQKIPNIFGFQALGTIVGALLVFTIAIFMDFVHLPMAWFTQTWMILGLYFCPLFFGLGIIPAQYISLTKNDRLPLGFRVQLLLHGHCLFMVGLTLASTLCGLRLAYLFMISVLFYTAGVAYNLITNLHNKPLAWLYPHILCQAYPFMFYVYMCHSLFVSFIPMTGRFGSDKNPELIICGFSIVTAILTGGFMIPAINLFKKSKIIICSLLGITLVCIIIAMTPLGFPYRPETSTQRFTVLHARRVFHAPDGLTQRFETGYFIMPSDRRKYSITKDVINMTMAKSLEKDCENELLCGLPLYNHRWLKAKSTSIWIPGPAPVLDNIPKIKINSKMQVNERSLRYEMQLSGPDHMALGIQPLENIKLTNWSFHNTPLQNQWKSPYFIYFSYGVSSRPLTFSLEFFNESEKFNGPTFRIALIGHWNHHDDIQTTEFKKFLQSFPSYVEATAWTASYESYIF